MKHPNRHLFKFCIGILAVSISIDAVSQAVADTRYIASGRIEFERKTNQYAFMDRDNSRDEMAGRDLPKFVTYYFDLCFDGDRLLYKPGRESEIAQNRYPGLLEAENIIFTNIDSNLRITQKSIYGDLYLIRDSVRRIEWRMGDEIRNIAGFDCRKAVGRIMDSIVVIAFFTVEILTTGGPESFSGLPGMILGVAIPRMHTTWYATKLELSKVGMDELARPEKGKEFTGNEFRNRLSVILGRRGGRGTRLMWQLML